MAVVYCAYAFGPPTEQFLLLRSSSSTITNPVIISPNLLLSPRNSKLSPHTSCSSSIKCYCKYSDGFSNLESDIPWDSGTIWSSYALYLFTFHFPLSFGGFSVISHFLNQAVLDPEIKALSLLIIQTLELSSVYWVLTNVVTPKYNPFKLFRGKKSRNNWVVGSALGFVSLVLFVFLTSFIASHTDPAGADVKEATNQITVVKEILSNSFISQASCIVAYCFVTPLLEEIIYRGILLASLSSQMKWYEAVCFSSIIFGAAHFSSESFLQLFVIGFVLGCSYCWTGDLRSPFVIHSLYNALILVSAYLS